jgi:hypothetical protein
VGDLFRDEAETKIGTDVFIGFCHHGVKGFVFRTVLCGPVI